MNLLQRRRELMIGKTHIESYIDIYKGRMYPQNGIISDRNEFYIYATETIEVGTKVRLTLNFLQLDQNVTSLQIKDTYASPPDIVINMPQTVIDVTFKITERSTDTLWCRFNLQVQTTQIDLTSIKLEKII